LEQFQLVFCFSFLWDICQSFYQNIFIQIKLGFGLI